MGCLFSIRFREEMKDDERSMQIVHLNKSYSTRSTSLSSPRPTIKHISNSPKLTTFNVHVLNIYAVRMKCTKFEYILFKRNRSKPILTIIKVNYVRLELCLSHEFWFFSPQYLFFLIIRLFLYENTAILFNIMTVMKIF